MCVSGFFSASQTEREACSVDLEVVSMWVYTGSACYTSSCLYKAHSVPSSCCFWRTIKRLLMSRKNLRFYEIFYWSSIYVLISGHDQILNYSFIYTVHTWIKTYSELFHHEFQLFLTFSEYFINQFVHVRWGWMV